MVEMKHMSSNVTKDTEAPPNDNRLAVWTAYLLAVMQHLTGIQIIILYTG